MSTSSKQRTLRTRVFRLCLATSTLLVVGLWILHLQVFDSVESNHASPINTIPDPVNANDRGKGRVPRRMENKWMHELFSEARRILESETHSSEGAAGFHDLDQGKNDEFCTRLTAVLWRSILPPRLSPELREAVEELRDRHAAVARGSPYQDQKYVVWSLSGGMGNRFQAMISTFAMALVSRRVFLMKDWFSPTLYANRPAPSLLPFVHDNATRGQRFYRYEDIHENFWFSNGRESAARPANRMLMCESLPVLSLTEFQRLYPGEFAMAANNTLTNPSRVALTTSVARTKQGHAKIDLRADHDKTLQAWAQLTCGDAAKLVQNKTSERTDAGAVDFFSSEKFVYVWTNQYFLPVFCVNPQMRERMGSLCNGSAFRTLLPLFFLPSRPVMRRVLSFFQNSKQAILPGQYTALQVRSLSRARGPTLGEVFDTCYKNQSDRFPYFYLATIERDAFEHFQRRYEKHNLFLNVDNRKAADAGVQSTGRGIQGEWTAMADVVIQSLAGNIIVTTKSTFGFLAWSIGEFSHVTIVNQNLAHGNGDDPQRVCVVRDTNYVTEPCFASWYRYESLFAHRHRLPCTVSNLPESFQHCGA